MKYHIKKQYNTIVESVIVMLLLCVIFFGLLQVVHIYIAQTVTDYTAACTARSGTVGYDDYLLHRAAKVGAIGASGKLLSPIGVISDNPAAQLAGEVNLIPDSFRGDAVMEYEESRNLSFHVRNDASGMKKTTLKFTDYKLQFPFFGFFSKKNTMNLEGEAKIFDHAAYFLEN